MKNLNINKMLRLGWQRKRREELEVMPFFLTSHLENITPYRYVYV
jgi:hypothetical protein